MKLTIRPSKQPFLSIVTRCSPSGRERLLQRNVRSVAAQSDQGLEHIFITNAGQNVIEANQSFHRAFHFIQGQYVFILDDDDYLFDPSFVSQARQLAQTESCEVIMVKERRLPMEGHLPEGDILPGPNHWLKPPILGQVGVSNYAVRRELWLEHIEIFGQHGYSGDYHFIKTLFDLGCAICWLDVVAVETDYVGIWHTEDLAKGDEHYVHNASRPN